MRRLALLVLAACANDVSVTETARCDGVLQGAEGKELDDPFDRDGDGYFDGDNDDCVATYPAEKLDCNDADPEINPAAQEVCNEVDDDCDDLVDDADDSVDGSGGSTYYADGDGDGFGDPYNPGSACELGEGFVENDADCNDQDAAISPNGSEVSCDSIDNDCDEETPDGLDHDADGYTECEDCADLSPTVSPGALETACNGIDDDCDAATLDESDADLDGVSACDADCDDNDASRSPNLDEVCDDGIDNDCSGRDDECSVDGTYDLDTTIEYDCAYTYVMIDFDQVSVLDSYPALDITSVGTGSQPGTMSGYWTTTTEFSVERVLPGTCEEAYTLEGEFNGDGTFTATFTATFTGRACLDCTNQSWTGIVGTIR